MFAKFPRGGGGAGPFKYDTELTQSRDISIIGHWVKIT